MTWKSCAAVGGSSQGWTVRRMCSRMYSDGSLLFQGISRRSPFHSLSMRQIKRRQPGEATLDQGNAQGGKAVEDPLDDQVQDLRLKHRGHVDVVFEIVGRPAGRRGRITRRAAKVNADHQVVPRGRLEDGVVATIAVRMRRADREKHLDKARDDRRPARSRAAARSGCWLGNDDRSAQARLLVEPLGDLPVVDGPRHRRRGVRIVDALHGVGAVEDAVLDAERDRVPARGASPRSEPGGPLSGCADPGGALVGAPGGYAVSTGPGRPTGARTPASGPKGREPALRSRGRCCGCRSRSLSRVLLSGLHFFDDRTTRPEVSTRADAVQEERPPGGWNPGGYGRVRGIRFCRSAHDFHVVKERVLV